MPCQHWNYCSHPVRHTGTGNIATLKGKNILITKILQKSSSYLLLFSGGIFSRTCSTWTVIYHTVKTSTVIVTICPHILPNHTSIATRQSKVLCSKTSEFLVLQNGSSLKPTLIQMLRCLNPHNMKDPGEMLVPPTPVSSWLANDYWYIFKFISSG